MSMLKHVQKRKSFSDDSIVMDDDLSSSEEHICKQSNASQESVPGSIPTRTENVGCNISHPRDSIIKHFLPEQDDGNSDDKWFYTIAPIASFDDDSVMLDSAERPKSTTMSESKNDDYNVNTKTDEKLEVGKNGSVTKGTKLGKYGIVYGKKDTNNNKSNDNTKNHIENKTSKRSETENITKKREKIRYVSKATEKMKNGDVIKTGSPKHPYMNGEISNSVERISPKEKRNEKTIKKDENEKKSGKFLDKLKNNKKTENEKKLNENKYISNTAKKSPTQSPKVSKTKNLSKLKDSFKDDVMISQKELKFNISRYTEKLKSTSFRSSPSSKKKNEEIKATSAKIKHNKKENVNTDNFEEENEISDKMQGSSENCSMNSDKDKSENSVNSCTTGNKNENTSDNTVKNIKTHSRSKSFILNSFRKANENTENYIKMLTPTRPRSLILGRKFPQNILSGTKESPKNIQRFKSADNLTPNTKKSIFHFKAFKSRSVERINSKNSLSNVNSLCSQEGLTVSETIHNDLNECHDQLGHPHSDEKNITNNEIFTHQIAPTKSDDDIKMRVLFATSDTACTLDRRHSFGPSSTRKKTINKSRLNSSESTDSENGNCNPNKLRTRRVIVRCRSKSFTSSSGSKKYDCDVFHEKILPTTSDSNLHVPILNVSKSCENVKMRCIFYKDCGETNRPVQRSKSFGGRLKKDTNVKSKLKVVDKLLTQCRPSGEVNSLTEKHPIISQRPIIRETPGVDPEYIKKSYRRGEANELSTENTSKTTSILPSYGATQNDIRQTHEKVLIQQNERLTQNSERNLNNDLNLELNIDTSGYKLLDQKKEHVNGIRFTNKPTNLDELVQSVESNALQLKNNERLLFTNEERLSIISELLRKVDASSVVTQGEEENKSIEVQVAEEMKAKDQYVEDELCSKMKTNKANSSNKQDGDLSSLIKQKKARNEEIKAKVNGEQYKNMSANELLSRLNLEILRSISYIKYRPSSRGKGDAGIETGAELRRNVETNECQIESDSTNKVAIDPNCKASSVKRKSITNEEILEKELKLIEELFQNIDSKQLLKELNLTDPNLNLPKSALLSLKEKIAYGGLQPKAPTVEKESCRNEVTNELINGGDAPANGPPVEGNWPQSEENIQITPMNPSLCETTTVEGDAMLNTEKQIIKSRVSEEMCKAIEVDEILSEQNFQDMYLIPHGEEGLPTDAVTTRTKDLHSNDIITKEETLRCKVDLDYVDAIQFNDEILINETNKVATNENKEIERLPANEDLCVSVETNDLQSEPNTQEVNWDEIFTIDTHEIDDIGKERNDENASRLLLPGTSSYYGTIPTIEIETITDEDKPEEDDEKQSIISDEEVESCEEHQSDSHEIKVNEKQRISSDSGVSLITDQEQLSTNVDSCNLETELILDDTNSKSPQIQISFIDCDDIKDEDMQLKETIIQLQSSILEGETALQSMPTDCRMLPSTGNVVSNDNIEIKLINDEECKLETSNINAFNIEDIDSGTELQYDDLFSPTDARENDGDYNSWLTSIKPLLCDCDVVANLFSRLANKYCDYKESGKKAYYMQQVHMATTAYDVITDNNLTNFSSVISIMLSFVGAIKAEKPPPDNVNIPNILLFLEQLVEKGSLSSFHITLFTVLLSRPNEKLKKHHTLRVNLLHTCFVQEIRQLKLTSSELHQLSVSFIKISEYFVHFDMKLTSRLVEEHILPRVTLENDVDFISNVLVYMGLVADDKKENILTTNDVSSSLVLLNIIYKRKPLSALSTQKLYTVLKSENPKFRFCNSEREMLIETITDLEHSSCMLLDP